MTSTVGRTLAVSKSCEGFTGCGYLRICLIYALISAGTSPGVRGTAIPGCVHLADFISDMIFVRMYSSVIRLAPVRTRLQMTYRHISKFCAAPTLGVVNDVCANKGLTAIWCSCVC